MNNSPKTGASVLVLNEQKVLLVKRGKEPHKGKWSLPGGSQEFGETLEDCAKRELLEETGIKATSLEFCQVRDRILKDNFGSISFHFVLATYIATSYSGEPVAMDDAADIGWYSLEEMAQIETTPGTPTFVTSMFKKMLTELI